MAFTRGTLNIDVINDETYEFDVVNGISNLKYNGFPPSEIIWDTKQAIFIELRNSSGISIPEQPAPGALMSTFVLTKMTLTTGAVGIDVKYLRDLAHSSRPDYDKIIEAFKADRQLYISVRLSKGTLGTPLYVNLS